MLKTYLFFEDHDKSPYSTLHVRYCNARFSGFCYENVCYCLAQFCECDWNENIKAAVSDRRNPVAIHYFNSEI